ncbi:MAG: MMPL family transporter [Piscirickettsiaceae bacterium]|nr:MMPL family transporter [Piscirickettsiaceae bacterium]
MNNQSTTQVMASWFFHAVTEKPKVIIALGFILIITFASFIPTLHKDTRSDAFIPEEHPALVFRDKTKEIFGLADPMVIAVINNGQHGVFNPHTLALVDWLTSQLEELDNIDSDRITSLATENNIIGTEEGMLVEPFFETVPETQKEANKVRDAVMDFPLYLGSLVAKDGSGTLIVAELHDQTKAQELYEQLLQLIEIAPVQDGEEIHVAGEGAVAGYMGAYIDSDAMRLNPIAAVVITLICLLAFRTLRGMLLPNLVVLATAGGALGLMAAFDVSFFVITNALPVVLIGISVADTIHILNDYYEDAAVNSKDTSRDLTIRTMMRMWRPITLTTLTTMAGFLGLSLASVMPPMEYFGLFALIGVGIAWMYSLTVIPAFLTILKLKPSTAYKSHIDSTVPKVDIFGRGLTTLGSIVITFPKTILVLAMTIVIAGGVGASKISLDENLIRTFDHEEPLYIADQVLNSAFDGTRYLDIMVETPNEEDLFKPENLQKIEALQSYVATLPQVEGSTSIVDYLKQMNRSLDGGEQAAYVLPKSADLAAQYFLIYSASADPTDFEEEIDYDYRLANIRVRINDGRYSKAKVIIESTQRYIDQQFNDENITAKLSGRVNVDYHWIKRLGDSHFGSIAISLALVWLMASISFRSTVAGVMSLLPVVITILMIYAVMGFNGIWLSISSSMFAAIAIGLGVDFSIHTLERLQVLIREKAESIDDALLDLYPSTGRALFFNFLALSLGFGVLATSKVIILQEFGLLVAVAIATSFITSLTVLPALVKLFKPRFLGLPKSAEPSKSPQILTESL